MGDHIFARWGLDCRLCALQRKHGGHEPFTRERRSLHGAVGNHRPRLRYGRALQCGHIGNAHAHLRRSCSSFRTCQCRPGNPSPIVASLHPRLVVLFVVQFTGKSLLPPTGLGLAMLSNACFCARPYFRLRLQKHHANTMDVISEFFNITLVASLMLPPFCLLLEGAEMMSVIRLSKEGVLLTFSGHTLVSSVFFSLYQYAQVIYHSSAGANAASRK